jgi:hypothetical protein
MDVVTDALKKIETRTGKLSPIAVIEAAREPDSPLHGYFEWDDSKAAEQYRLDQARCLIRSVQFEVETIDLTMTAKRYVHDPRIPANESGYVDIVRIKAPIALDVVARELSALLADMRRTQAIMLARESDLPSGTMSKFFDIQTKVESLLDVIK